MTTIGFEAQYWIWHYSKGFQGLFKIWGNIIRFVLHYFSMSILLRTLFTPFKRLGEKKKSGFEIGDIFEVFLTNVILRLVGALVRTGLILVGVLSLIVTALFGIVVLIAWTILPAVIIGFFIGGLILLI